MENKLTIKMAQNGYVISYDRVPFEEDEPTSVEELLVEERSTAEDIARFKTDDESQLAIGRLLETVAEHFYCDYDKFSKNNLNITFDKVGHKVEE